MRQVAVARPDVSFVFVGGVARVNVDVLEALPNVHFLGHQPYEDMPAYSRAFDVCVVPFHVNAVTASLDLVKVYEYFAQGKPVVCTPVAEMVQYDRYMYLADGAQQFLAQLDRALAEDDPAAVQRRIALARVNSWDDRIDAIDHEILAGLGGNPPSAGPSTRATPAAPTDVAALRAELRATKATLTKLNKTRAVRLVRRYWAARRKVDRTVRRAKRVYRRVRTR